MGLLLFVLACVALVGATVAILRKHDRDVRRDSVSAFEPAKSTVARKKRSKRAKRAPR